MYVSRRPISIRAALLPLAYLTAQSWGCGPKPFELRPAPPARPRQPVESVATEFHAKGEPVPVPDAISGPTAPPIELNAGALSDQTQRQKSEGVIELTPPHIGTSP